jgi:hypothetical protein
MRLHIPRLVRRLAATGVTVWLGLTPAAAQQGPAPGPDAAFSPLEVRRLLDAYAVMQAQQFLGLDEAQFARFLPRLRAVQEIRQRDAQAKTKIIQDLNRLTAPRAPKPSEDEIRGRLRDLRELRDRSDAELATAYDALDQALSIQQQARFRVFEQQMERRQLELLLRAQTRRAGLKRGTPGPP